MTQGDPPQELLSWRRSRSLVPGRLIRRYKRFLADVELASGELVTAHCANTGAMEGLGRPGLRVWLSRADNPKRTLKWTWELVEMGGRMYGANTAEPNRIVRRLLEAGALPWLGEFEELKAEKLYGEGSRTDFWLRRGRREVYLEVKNCHLMYPDRRAYFPDSVSVRAARHLRELAAVASRSHSRGHVLFTCQMAGVKAVRPSDAHDPQFAETAREVKRLGVSFSAVEIVHTPETVTATRRVPVDLRPYRVERVQRWRDHGRAGDVVIVE